MKFSRIIEAQFKSVIKWSAIVGICSLIAFGSVWVIQARQHAKQFIISQVRGMAIAEINMQNTAALDGELNRIIGLWTMSQDFPVRVDVALDGKLWAHGGQLHPYPWPYLTDMVSESLPSGHQLKIEIQTNIAVSIIRLFVILLVFATFFAAAFTLLRRRIGRAVAGVMLPLESRVQKIKEISNNLTDVRSVTPNAHQSGVEEIQAIDLSLKHLVGRIVSLEDELAQTHFDKGRVEAVEQLAHTMKGTIGNFQLSLESPDLPGQSKREFSQILKELKTISKDVLEKKSKVSVITTKLADLEVAEINVGEAIKNIFEFKATEIEKRPSLALVNFNLSLDEKNAAVVRGPRGRFDRALMDLVTNAVDAVQDRGQITAKLTSSGKTLKFELIDDGCGIPAEILPTLIVEGVTYGKTTKGGTGFGLANARKTFEQMGGTLNIFSAGVGKGAVIRGELPLIQAAQMPRDFILFPRQLVVIVDDDPSIHGFFEKKFFMYRDAFDVVSIESPEAFEVWFEKNQGNDRVKQFIFDYEFRGSTKTGIDLVESHGLRHESVVISGVAHKQNVIAEAARAKVSLIHKDQLNDIKFRLEKIEESNQELIS